MKSIDKLVEEANQALMFISSRNSKNYNIGKLGETLLLFYLQVNYGLVAIDVSGKRFFYDSIILPKKGTIFQKITLVSSKIRGPWWEEIPPWREEFKRCMKVIEEKDFDFYISFAHHLKKKGGTKIEFYLTNAKKLDLEKDFSLHSREKERFQLITRNLIEKFDISFCCDIRKVSEVEKNE